MAIYHYCIQIIGRGKGKSAVSAAAYRSGEKITNDYDGMTHDYTRKGGVVHTEILLPRNVPIDYADRSTLWNAVEKIEKNKNAQLAREIELALPKELKTEQHKSLVKNYCQKNFVSAGMCADICIHDKQDGNPHAHIMLTMRPFEQDGTWGAKSRKEYLLDENGERIKLESGEYKTKKIDLMDWNDQTKAEQWRSSWADIVNQYLEQNNINERIDYRSYERQGIEQIPTIHMGVSASQMEKKGIETDRGNLNRKVKSDNQLFRELKARINKLDKWLKDQSQTAEPSLIITLTGLLNEQEQTGIGKKIFDLKTVAKSVVFLQNNNITTLPQLQKKVTDINNQFYSVRDKIREKEKRIEVLKEHLKQFDNYSQNKGFYKLYEQAKPKKQDSFYEQHRAEIILYETAAKYLDGVMNRHSKLPIQKWKDELLQLTDEKDMVYKVFYKLKDEVKEVEIIRRNVELVVKRDEQPQKMTKDKDVGL